MTPQSSTSAFIAPIAAPALKSEENEYQEANDVRQSFKDRNSFRNEDLNTFERDEKAPAGGVPHYTGNDGKSETRWNEGDSGYSDQSPAPDPRASKLSNIPENRDSVISEVPNRESCVPEPPERREEAPAPASAPAPAPAQDPEPPKSVKGYFDSDTDDEEDVTHHTNRVSWQTPFFASY